MAEDFPNSSCRLVMSGLSENSKKAKRNAVVFETDKDEEEEDRARILETLVTSLFNTKVLSWIIEEETDLFIFSGQYKFYNLF